MARDILNVRIELDSIHCFDEGDGWGNAEPYLWPVFFKIDGTTASVNDSLQLTGTATVEGTHGHHGNLNNTDVDAGDNVTIPDSVGVWETTLTPIPGPPSLQSLVPDVAGVAGVVTVLMEEDNVTDAGAIAGYNALVAAVQTSLNGVVPTLGLTQQDISDNQIAAMETAVSNAVSNAIQNSQNFFENLWSWINPDDQIGTQIFRFDHDTLAAGNPINFNKRWNNEGDWEIHGHAIASVKCPAAAIEAAKKILGKIFGGDHMKQMRAFRDSHVRDNAGMREWWSLAERNGPAILYLLSTDKAAREVFIRTAPQLVDLVAKPETKVPATLIADLNTLLAAAGKSSSRRMRIDSRTSARLVQLASGRSVKEIFALAERWRPSTKATKAEFQKALARTG